MPWSNQTGKGGGGGGGGPWGQGPQGPRPGGNNSPDLEDILRRGQDRLRRAMPGGGAGSGGSGGGLALGGLAVAGLAVVWLLNAVYTVQPDEVGVELLFGKPRAELSEPGLHVMMWPFETVETVPIVENQITIGSGQRGGDSSGLMLSGDQNIVDVQFAVLYSVENPVAYLFNVQDPQGVLRQVAESAMREVVGRRPVEDVFRNDRAGIAEQVRQITQATLNSYNAGLTVNAISIEEAAPPPEVADAFEEVQRAEQNESQFIEEARLYRNEQLGRAQGEAVQIREDAAAYKNRVVQEAQGEAQRFTSILTAYERAPEIIRERLYLETMESVLANSNKVIMDGQTAGGQGVVPYLPLGELQQRPAPSAAPQPTSAAPAASNVTRSQLTGTAASTPAQGNSR
ncbi:tail fiber protein [Aureimonas ureilytica]|uniref:Protein HflK n=1 Tax=Aureimonas ureilytica TaxID=401562 RepID=A0A175RMG2_9HYPH|nr:FtsH protease activity modulator HflK [Aureimonas ureilytica]KTR04910.1 tail fiber protein [Aureimonas ureilytica]